MVFLFTFFYICMLLFLEKGFVPLLFLRNNSLRLFAVESFYTHSPAATTIATPNSLLWLRLTAQVFKPR
jgi:hypothetical protein